VPEPLSQVPKGFWSVSTAIIPQSRLETAGPGTSRPSIRRLRRSLMLPASVLCFRAWVRARQPSDWSLCAVWAWRQRMKSGATQCEGPASRALSASPAVLQAGLLRGWLRVSIERYLTHLTSKRQPVAAAAVRRGDGDGDEVSKTDILVM